MTECTGKRYWRARCIEARGRRVLTECTGKRYWRARCIEARTRYEEWSRRRAPVGAPEEQFDKWREWRQERINYFNRERDKLYGTQRRTHVAAINNARDHGGHARS